MGKSVYYLTAWSSTKNYGEALNDHIQHLPDDSWIVVMDGDTCFLTDDYGDIIQEAIKDKPNATLMSCRTNRGYGQQMSEEKDIVRLRKIAEDHSRLPAHYTKVNAILPAFFWLFPKKTWLRNPFDTEKIIHNFNSFDTRWVRKIHPKNMYIVERLFVFHFYRLHKKATNYEHLK